MCGCDEKMLWSMKLLDLGSCNLLVPFVFTQMVLLLLYYYYLFINGNSVPWLLP